MQRNKFQRVQLPRRFGLNGENSILITSMKDLRISDFVNQRDEFSVRTFYRDDLGPNLIAPHFPTIVKHFLFKKAPNWFEMGLQLIVADRIDPKDCGFRGCILVQKKGTAIMEIAIGPGTVRTVTNEGKIDETRIYQASSKLNLKYHRDVCVDQCRKSKLRNVIFEFSYYNIPIGWKQEQFICWEITDDGSHINRLFKEI